MIFHQGQLVRVASNQDSTYQVLSIDDAADLCWVRRWPLSRKGSPAFSVSLQQLKQAEIKSGLAL
jgi:hypothetical protein